MIYQLPALKTLPGKKRKASGQETEDEIALQKVRDAERAAARRAKEFQEQLAPSYSTSSSGKQTASGFGGASRREENVLSHSIISSIA